MICGSRRITGSWILWAPMNGIWWHLHVWSSIIFLVRFLSKAAAANHLFLWFIVYSTCHVLIILYYMWLQELCFIQNRFPANYFARSYITNHVCSNEYFPNRFGAWISVSWFLFLFYLEDKESWNQQPQTSLSSCLVPINSHSLSSLLLFPFLLLSYTSLVKSLFHFFFNFTRIGFIISYLYSRDWKKYKFKITKLEQNRL